MRKLAALSLLLLSLTGCVSQYGNFATSSVAYDTQMADDMVEQMSSMYAPAHIRLDLQQTTPDAFGQALVSELRGRGYAVMELEKGDPSVINGATAPKPKRPLGVDLRYVVDQPGYGEIFRVTVWVGTQSITRGYVDTDGHLTAASYWVHKD